MYTFVCVCISRVCMCMYVFVIYMYVHMSYRYMKYICMYIWHIYIHVQTYTYIHVGTKLIYDCTYISILGLLNFHRNHRETPSWNNVSNLKFLNINLRGSSSIIRLEDNFDLWGRCQRARLRGCHGRSVFRRTGSK